MSLNRLSIPFLILCATAAASAQTAPPKGAAPHSSVSSVLPPPPVKMGLWETSVTNKMGLQLPPEVVAKLQEMGKEVPGSGQHTTVTESCFTPAEWQKSMEQMNQPGNSDCEYTNRQNSGGKYSFDMSCKSDNGMIAKGHFEMLVDDTQHTHGSFQMKSDQAGPNGQAFSMDGTLKSHFVSADCGNVQPDSPKVIRDE